MPGAGDKRWDVAVVIPTYNRADLIGTTLETVLAQDHAPAEVIVVDDGSTDWTPEVVRTFCPAVRYHRIENTGVCRARNIGIRLSRAAWVAFCDSDDLWRPDRLARQVRLIQQAPGVEYVFCDSVALTEAGCATWSKFEEAPPGFWEPGRRQLGDDLWIYDDPLYARLLTFQPIYPSTILMSRALFERVGGIDEQWRWTPAEDMEFALRCVQHAPVGVVARPLVAIRKHRTNFSRDRLNTVLGRLAILRHARLHHRPLGERLGSLIDERIAQESRSAVETAFAARRTDIVRLLARSIRGSGGSSKLRLKLAVSRLPAALSQPLCRGLVFAAERLGRLRIRQRRAEPA